jgi:ABC-type glycerol-3-phosphate transport system substrate-binding protein
MPSIIVLPQPDLEPAVRQGLVYPVTALQSLKNQSDWYPYCQAMAQVDQKWYGAPFSGDALILLNRTDATKTAINTWDDVQKLNQPVLFPASDANALTTLALYESLAGEINALTPAQNLQENDLIQVFSFYQHAAHQGIFPFSLSQYERFDQTWSAFTNNQSRLVITWASTYLNNTEADYQPIPMPGLNGSPYTLATGDMFALSEPNPDRQVISLKLIDFLVEPAFLSDLNQAMGGLPPRISANLSPADPKKQAFFDQVGKTAHLQPDLPIYLSLANKLKEATLQVIRFQLSPQEAAKSVITITQKTP